MKFSKWRIINNNGLNRHFAILVFTFLIACFLVSVISITPAEEEILGSQINNLIRKCDMGKTHIALKIISLPENKTIYERNADDLMIAASNVKLFTTAAALCKLGPDFKFTTTLFYDGIIKDNVLEGDLIVKSNGDPNISGRFYNDCPTSIFERWAEQLLKISIKNINGNIILDDSVFDREYYLPSWPKDQLTYWYCAPISAISFNDNCVEITVFLNRKTGKIEHVISPTTKYVNVSLDVVLDKNISESQIDFYRIPDTNNITISGKMSFRDNIYKEFITINNPSLFFGTVLGEVLTQNKITINGKILCVNNSYQPLKQLVEVDKIQTSLVPAINVINQRSQNFYAEQVLKSMAYHFKEKGSFNGGLEIIRDFLANEVGIKRDTYFIADGSGLSRETRFTANQIIKLLGYLYRHKWFSIFRDSLNTEKWSPKNNKGKTKPLFWAKSGYLKNVLSLSGYALRDNGYYMFSLIINDFESQPSGLKNAEQFRDELIKLLQKYQ